MPMSLDREKSQCMCCKCATMGICHVTKGIGPGYVHEQKRQNKLKSMPRTGYHRPEGQGAWSKAWSVSSIERREIKSRSFQHVESCVSLLPPAVAHGSTVGVGAACRALERDLNTVAGRKLTYPYRRHVHGSLPNHGHHHRRRSEPSRQDEGRSVA